jgi:hypothetical protein
MVWVPVIIAKGKNNVGCRTARILGIPANEAACSVNTYTLEYKRNFG